MESEVANGGHGLLKVRLRRTAGIADGDVGVRGFGQRLIMNANLDGYIVNGRCDIVGQELT